MKAKRIKMVPRTVYVALGLALMAPIVVWSDSMALWLQVVLGLNGVSLLATGALGFCPAAPLYYWMFSK